ncbi:dihydroorotase family protein [Paenibacillus sp. GCM10012307]|uniref:Amidohydrolase family protein n=1 Tax=Paenibacillus roseus TaxID=2798579 RepID=A0A934J414_9BACL|nr:amidohydrolase family protein [Paenibacillus roseus]MBJ6359917.1 amidohydrolase family protein [Paenibacillus roseus]
MLDLIVRGNLVLEDKVLYGEAGVKDGRIVGIEPVGQLQAHRTLDFGEQLVFPGMIDAHVHCFSNPQEGFAATTASAAAGGLTTILDMPYDLPEPITQADRFVAKVGRLQQEALIDVGLWATIAKTGGTSEISRLAEAGAIAFKMSTFETDAYRFPSIPDAEILQAMEQIRQTGLRAAFHAENDEVIKALIASFIEQGRVDPAAHMESRPPLTETSAVLKLMEFAYWSGVKLHIVHVSHPRTIDLARIYQQMGTDVTTETCYPYLLLNVDDLERMGPKAKNNPPLRRPEEAAGLCDHQLKGHINLVTSDHAPWGQAVKDAGNDNIFQAASGMPGVEIIVPLMFEWAVVKSGLSPVELAKWLAQHPAEVFQIPEKGKIAPGYDADFTVIDPDCIWTIDEQAFRSNSKLSPFHGREVQGKVAHTIVRGTTVYDGQDIQVQPGFGRFIPGSAVKKEALV